jgi:PIN domain nuclease of toxin-antitoxin system
MRLLLDTHTLIWAVDQPANLGITAATTLQDPANELFLSAGSIWEIAIKVGLGKLTLSQPYRQWIEKAIADLGLAVLPITVDHADVLTGLPHHHRDPFDRLLVAQAQVESMPVVSADSQFDAYGINRIW